MARDLCRDFAKGSCHRKNCRFSHDQQLLAQSRNQRGGFGNAAPVFGGTRGGKGSTHAQGGSPFGSGNQPQGNRFSALSSTAFGSGSSAFGHNAKQTTFGGSSGGWGQQQARTPGAFGKQLAFGGGGTFGGNRLGQNPQASKKPGAKAGGVDVDPGVPSWPLTCHGASGQANNISGDASFEEVRWIAYEGAQSGQFGSPAQALQHHLQQFNQACAEKRRALATGAIPGAAQPADPTGGFGPASNAAAPTPFGALSFTQPSTTAAGAFGAPKMSFGAVSATPSVSFGGPATSAPSPFGASAGSTFGGGGVFRSTAPSTAGVSFANAGAFGGSATTDAGGAFGASATSAVGDSFGGSPTTPVRSTFGSIPAARPFDSPAAPSWGAVKSPSLSIFGAWAPSGQPGATPFELQSKPAPHQQGITTTSGSPAVVQPQTTPLAEAPSMVPHSLAAEDSPASDIKATSPEVSHVEKWKANTFILGQIPEVEPPEMFCSRI